MTLERPALDRLRELVRSRAIDVLLVFSTDRLTRELFHQMLLLEECEKHQVQLRFVKENYDATPEGKMLMQVRGAMNQFERMKIKERTTRGRRQKARNGFVHSVGKRFGYIYLGEAQGSKGELRIDGAEAEIVRRIYNGYLRGKRLGHLRAELNRDDIKSARGGLWSRPVIYQILTNPMYSGQMRGPGGIPVKCPAIITEEIFARTQAHLMRTRPLRGASEPPISADGPIVVRPMRAALHDIDGRRGPEPYYRCGNIDIKTYMRGCAALGVRQSRIETAVWEETWAEITDPETLYGLIETYRARFAKGNDGRRKAPPARPPAPTAAPGD